SRIRKPARNSVPYRSASLHEPVRSALPAGPGGLVGGAEGDQAGEEDAPGGEGAVEQGVGPPHGDGGGRGAGGVGAGDVGVEEGVYDLVDGAVGPAHAVADGVGEVVVRAGG